MFAHALTPIIVTHIVSKRHVFMMVNFEKETTMKRKRNILIISSALIAVITISALVIKNQTQTRVKELFKMNKKLQEEGYYMADFEFRMMSVLYYLDKGKYNKALSTLSDYHSRLSNKEGLVKLPEFKNNQEEIDFYLNLQNPETGAFIDVDAPFFTYWAVTENVLNHIEHLQDSATRPLKLKYPLKFLNEINTPEKLASHLNDLAYVGWLAPKFPMTSFVFVRELMSCTREDNVLTRNKIYSFSYEWKYAFIKWMYEFQDAETGMWGPKFRKSKKLAVIDLDNTASLLKQYRDADGNDLYPEFPLRYKEQLFKSTLEILKAPMPDDEDLSGIHAWNLKTSKGIKMLLRYLWKDASEINKKETQLLVADIITKQFDKYYVKSEGAFSYYPNEAHASCDGISNFILTDLGALSYDKQKKYWGNPEKNAIDMGMVSLDTLSDAIENIRDSLPNINSIRIYTQKPNFHDLTDHVWAVSYPQPTAVLDVMEVVPNIVAWSETSNLSMGNWTSMADIKNQYASINFKKPLIFYKELPLGEIEKNLEETPEIYMVGFDKLQIPRLLIGCKRS
jgi:hypothetical protein